MSPADQGHDLIGVWRLESFEDLDESGRRAEGPLGPEPAGLLFYSDTGQVSVTMMRTAGEGERFMSYAGTWRRDGDLVVHTISVAPQASWVGSEQVRQFELAGDRLVLAGTGPRATLQKRTLSWRRVPPR